MPDRIAHLGTRRGILSPALLLAGANRSVISHHSHLVSEKPAATPMMRVNHQKNMHIFFGICHYCEDSTDGRTNHKTQHLCLSLTLLVSMTC